MTKVAPTSTPCERFTSLTAASAVPPVAKLLRSQYQRMIVHTTPGVIPIVKK